MEDKICKYTGFLRLTVIKSKLYTLNYINNKNIFYFFYFFIFISLFLLFLNKISEIFHPSNNNDRLIFLGLGQHVQRLVPRWDITVGRRVDSVIPFRSSEGFSKITQHEGPIKEHIGE